MKFIIDKVDSHTQVVPIILKSFPVTELSISLKCICKLNQKFSSSVALATFQVLVLAQLVQKFLMVSVAPPIGHYGHVWKHLFFSTVLTMNEHHRHYW